MEDWTNHTVQDFAPVVVMEDWTNHTVQDDAPIVVTKDWANHTAQSSDVTTVLVDTSLTVFALAIVVIGTAGNLVTAYTILNVKTLRTTSNLLLASMALADTMNVANILIIQARHLFPAFFSTHPDVCHITAYLVIFFLMVSVQHIQVIAINRYVIITKPRYIYNKYWGTSQVTVIISVIWFYCAALTFVPLLGIVPDINNCDYDADGQPKEIKPGAWWYETFIQIIILESCGVVTPLFFFLTFKRIRTLKNRIHTMRSTELATTAARLRVRGFSREEMAVTKMVALSFFCSYLCYSPSLILHVATIGRTAHRAANTLCLILSYTSSAMDPFIYAGMNKHFRLAVRRICTKCRR